MPCIQYLHTVSDNDDDNSDDDDDDDNIDDRDDDNVDLKIVNGDDIQ